MTRKAAIALVLVLVFRLGFSLGAQDESHKRETYTHTLCPTEDSCGLMWSGVTHSPQLAQYEP